MCEASAVAGHQARAEGDRRCKLWMVTSWTGPPIAKKFDGWTCPLSLAPGLHALIPAKSAALYPGLSPEGKLSCTNNCNCFPSEASYVAAGYECPPWVRAYTKRSYVR